MAGTKAAAESLLRELPSVLGACVHEDVNGHPREVHILVRSGPDLRNLSHDIRDLLEEHLSVPVDQRVISIAQLAASAENEVELPTEPESGATETGAGDENGADENGARIPPSDNSAIADQILASEETGAAGDAGMAPDSAVDTSPVPDTPPVPQAGGGTSTGLSAAFESAPRDLGSEPVVEQANRTRLKLQGVETRREESRVTVTVRLGGGTSESRGEATEPDVGNGRARAAVRATLQAATAAVDDLIRLELEGASVTRVLDRELVLVSLVALSPLLGRRPRMLVGAQPVEGRVEMAAVLAALKASNRTLLLALATPAA